MEGNRILITGGAGFIGSHLIEKLCGKNVILCFDSVYRGSNIQILREKRGPSFDETVKFVKGDIRDNELLVKVLNDFQPDYIFHLASVAGVQTVIRNPLMTLDVNVIGSYNLLRSISQYAPKKLIFTSTSEVYGPITFQNKEEDYTTQGSPYDPRWSYATSKLFVEHMCVSFEREYDIPVAIGRLFNIYGPRQIGEGAVHNFITKCLKKEPIEIHGDGSQIRAWCYVEDCIRGILLMCEKGRGIYNIGNPKEALTTFSLALKIKEKTKSQIPVLFSGEQVYTDVKLRVPSIEKIRKLGYEPQVNLDQGLEKTIDWYSASNK